MGGYENVPYRSELGGGGMDQINLAQGRDTWQALVNAVMIVLVL